MAVRDIHAAGGKMPEPTSAEELVKKKEPKDFADELIEDEKKAIRFRETKKAMGIKDADDQGKKDESPNLTATIVTEAMKQGKEATGFFRDEVGELRKLVETKDKEGKESLLALITEKLDRVREAQERAGAEALGNKSALATYREVSGELQNIIASMPKQEEKHGMSDSVAIELKKLEQQHALSMLTVGQQMKESDRKFDLQFEQLKEDNKLKWREYEDKKDFRKEGLAGFKDIVESALAGVKGEKGTGIAQKEGTAQAGEEVMAATISSFLCGKCGTEIPVTDPSLPIVCPNDKCKATYNLTPKGGTP